MSRGSYNDKNDLEKQTEIINSLLPCYGIEDLKDHVSSVSSRSNIDIEGVLSQWENIKRFFKMSTVVKPSTYSQAIALIKNLCIQARIPFDWDKGEKGFMFSIAPENRYIKSIKQKPILVEIKPLSYFLDNCIKMKETLAVDAKFSNLYKEYGINIDNTQQHFYTDAILYSIKNPGCHIRSISYDVPELFLNYKIGDKHYRAVRKLPGGLDILLSIKLVWKNRRDSHRKFGIAHSLYEKRPLTMFEKKAIVNLPIYSLRRDSVTFDPYLILEITEEEAKKNLPIEFCIKYDSILVKLQDFKSTKIEYDLNSK